MRLIELVCGGRGPCRSMDRQRGKALIPKLLINPRLDRAQLRHPLLARATKDGVEATAGELLILGDRRIECKTFLHKGDLLSGQRLIGIFFDYVTLIGGSGGRAEAIRRFGGSGMRNKPAAILDRQSSLLHITTG